MRSDPWSRPTLEELRFLDHSETNGTRVLSTAGQFSCRIPAELITARGNCLTGITIGIGPSGVTLVHRGFAPLGTARLRLAGDLDAPVLTGRVVDSAMLAAGLVRSEIAIAAREPRS